MQSVRLHFTKTGDARYISHLDLMRSVTRTFRRTEIPIWYTEGYNPHAHLVFGLSLPLGVEGLNEPLDIRLEKEDFPLETILPLLNETAVPGIAFVRCALPVHKLQEIAFASYRVLIPSQDSASLCAQLESTVSSGELFIEKKSKKGVLKQVNTCEYLKDFTATAQQGSVLLHFVLPAGNAFTVSPTAFGEALLNGTGTDIRSCRVIRENLLLEDLTEFI